MIRPVGLITASDGACWVSEGDLPRPENHSRRGGATGVGQGQPPRGLRRWLGGLRWWLGGLLVLAGLAAAMAILLPRLGDTPQGGPSGGRSAAATPSTSDGVALPAWGLLYAAPAAATGTPTWDIWVANWDGTGRRN